MEIIRTLRNRNDVTTNFMELIARKSVSGVFRRTKDEFNLRLHIAVGSYCAGHPEQKYILGLKPSNRTNELCPRCE